MIIRKAKISDLDRCVELLHEDDFRSCTGEYPNKEYINEFFSEYFYVAEKYNEVVGCYLATKIFSSGVFLWHFVIDNRLRGQNLGSSLLGHMEKLHKNDGRDWIYFISPLQNIDFYTHRGYLPHHTIVKEFLKHLK